MRSRSPHLESTVVRRSVGVCSAIILVAGSLGCGTTRWSDTSRTATEQLLISDAVDRAISEFDFSLLADREVYFDASYLAGVTDEKYIVSSLRQYLLASGCILREEKEDAEYVVEARSGGVGTDRSDVLIGVPAVQVPVVPGTPLPSAIPELPLAKSTNQKAVAKLAVFAYNRRTGRPALQTGVDPVVSTAKNSWVFGAGPFKQGSLYERAPVASDKFDIPIIGGRGEDHESHVATVPVTDRAVFAEGFDPAPTPDPASLASRPGPQVPADADGDEVPARWIRYPVTHARFVEAVDEAEPPGHPVLKARRRELTSHPGGRIVR
jgi:hypothetical protein